MVTPPKQRHVDYEKPACPIEATLELIGGKWKGIILYQLLDGRLRFSELNRAVGCITQRMLIKALRELETSGLVSRFVHAEVPPRVEYDLTEVGKTLEPILKFLKQWGDEYAIQLIEKREPYN